MPGGHMSSQSANLIWTPQVRWSLRWIRAFFAGVAGAPLVRNIRMRDRRTLDRWLVAVDASPWGLGGILLDQHRVIAAFEDRVQDDDLSRLDLRLGEAAGQSVLEALAALVALRLFAQLAGWDKGAAARIALRSDSKAALGAAINQASPRSMMNAIGAELAYDMGVGDYQVIFFDHTEGVANVSPDWLSRRWAPTGPSGPKERPAALEGVQVLSVPKRADAWWRTWRGPPVDAPASRSSSDNL
jgi:hypothetical protein